MEDIIKIAARNQKRAWQIIKDTDLIPIWQSIGAEVRLVGSLKMGLLMNHRDIDFHVYSTPLMLSESFSAMAKLAANPSIKKIECTNLINTDEHCIEWHAWYLDQENELWQIDMIHILKGSFYDGYFEHVAERISAILTPETKQTILMLKQETPNTEKILGIEYYQAVIRDGIQTYSDFMEWRKIHETDRIIEWIP